MASKKQKKTVNREEKNEAADASSEEEKLLREEYFTLRDDFAQIIERGLHSFQEKTPGREVKFLTMRLQGRYGLIIRTNKRGLIEVPEMSGMEVDNQGVKRHQRMLMGMNCSTTTNNTTFSSLNLLRPGETTVKEFEVNAAAHELLKLTVDVAQKRGEKRQRDIDEKKITSFDRYKTDERFVESDNWDREGPPSIDLVFRLITLARQTLKAELGAKLVDCKILFFHIVDTMELADSAGTKIDIAIPRTGFAVTAKTNHDNEVAEFRRGVGGLSAIIRDDTDKTLEEIVKDMAKKVVKRCVDMDRAQPCSVLEGEADVILDGTVSGVLAHEVYGHTSECDLILHNKTDKDVSLNLKARIGGQVSENKSFSIIDDGHYDVDIGGKVIKGCYGAIWIDEEGTPAKRTQLVANGTQTLFLSSADTFNEVIDGLSDETMKKLKEHGLSGNFRNERFDKPPMVRMTNTFILPSKDGPKSVKKMAEGIHKHKKGVYITDCSGGWVDPTTGTFEILGTLGYLIENGVITDKPVKDVVVRGNISTFGSKIKAIGSVETFGSSTGWCGKDRSWVPVEDGGPAILLEDAEVGKEQPISLWQDMYTEYDRQIKEVAAGRRKKDEVYFRFIEDSTGGKCKRHADVCLLANKLNVDDEVRLLLGKDESLANYVLGEDGKVEER
ncbi:MAG: hypothetical protein DRN26_01570 [Thermoplasmata archaeon]|nr:MAG: hypothetical protein DRN26_01570 [Thermoplasmata archaeon]